MQPCDRFVVPSNFPLAAALCTNLHDVHSSSLSGSSTCARLSETAVLQLSRPLAPGSSTLFPPLPQVYLDADLLKSEGDVLRDAERALLLARGRPLDTHPAVEAAADLVWDEVQVTVWANSRPNEAVVSHCRPDTADPHRV